MHEWQVVFGAGLVLGFLTGALLAVLVMWFGLGRD